MLSNLSYMQLSLINQYILFTWIEILTGSAASSINPFLVEATICISILRPIVSAHPAMEIGFLNIRKSLFQLIQYMSHSYNASSGVKPSSIINLISSSRPYSLAILIASSSVTL